MHHDTTPQPITTPLTPKQITRFWTLVHRSPDGCWEWAGSKLRTGYGVIKFQDRSYKAHRIAWYLCNGQIPDGSLICHTCDNPGCVRPDHLFPGTPKDNHDDMKAKGRAPSGERNGLVKHPSRRARGERHPNAYLTEEIVREIRRRFVRRAPYRTNAGEIAKDLGIPASTVIHIADRKGWRHVV